MNKVYLNRLTSNIHLYDLTQGTSHSYLRSTDARFHLLFYFFLSLTHIFTKGFRTETFRPPWSQSLSYSTNFLMTLFCSNSYILYYSTRQIICSDLNFCVFFNFTPFYPFVLLCLVLFSHRIYFSVKEKEVLVYIIHLK